VNSTLALTMFGLALCGPDGSLLYPAEAEALRQDLFRLGMTRELQMLDRATPGDGGVWLRTEDARSIYWAWHGHQPVAAKGTDHA